MNKVLTISVAAYNVEAYLAEALDSLCASKHLDACEILVVDDGSKDKTGEIAKQYQTRFPKSIRYIPKENGGHGSTINMGLRHATGKYFKVLDGDDWFDTEQFDLFFESLVSCDADLQLCGFKETDGEHILRVVNPNEKLTGTLHSFETAPSAPHVWLSGIAVKTDLLRGLHESILENCYYVDMQFNMMCIIASNTFRCVDAPAYMYRLGQASQSINKRNMLRNVAMQERVAKAVCEIFSKTVRVNDYPPTKIVAMQRCLNQVVGATIRTHLLHESSGEALDSIRRLYGELLDCGEDMNSYLNNSLFMRCVTAFDCSLVPAIAKSYKAYLKLKGQL